MSADTVGIGSGTPGRSRSQPLIWLFITLPLLAFGVLGGLMLVRPAQVAAWLSSTMPDGGAGIGSDLTALIIADIARYVVVWMVVVVAFWLGTDSRQHPERRPLRRVYLWLVGVLLAGLWGASLIDLLLPGLTDSVRVLRQPAALPAVWSVAVFLWVVHHGDGTATYFKKSYLGQYRTIWTLLSVMLLTLTLVDLAAFQSVQDRVGGLRASIADAQRELDTMAVGDADGNPATAFQLVRTAYDLLQVVDQNYQDTLSRGTLTTDQQRAIDSTARKTMLDKAGALMPTLRYYALVTETQSRIALRMTDLSDGTSNSTTTSANTNPNSSTSATNAAAAPPVVGNNDQTRAWLDEPRQVIQQTVNSTAAVRVSLDEVDAEINRLRADETLPVSTLDNLVGNELYVNTQELWRQAPAAQQALNAVGVPVSAMFIWVSMFYTVVLSLPALLLLLFFIRKRDQRAAQIMADLEQLDPTLELLKRALGHDSPVGPDADDNYRSQRDALNRALAALQKRRDAIRKRLPLPDIGTDVQPVVERLAARAFSNVEYAIALSLLTCLLGLGWYFVFYPQTTAGLAKLISNGGGVDQIADYLASPSPITFGFVGAYFWIVQMLLRRYLAADLYPSAFLQASERLVLVFILSLVFSIISLNHGLAGGAAVLAFASGIFPQRGLLQIMRYANKVAGGKIFPSLIESIPLTRLDGIDIWIESRLVEEKVENVESLATAEIEMLVLRTNFPTTQIVDWIDQALLLLHAGNEGRWFEAVKNAGVRSASDLLDVAGVLRPDPELNGLVNPQRPPCDKLIGRIATAARAETTPTPRTAPTPAAAAASPSVATRPDSSTDGDTSDDSQPTGVPDLTSTLYVMCDALWPDPNIKYILSYMGYDLYEPQAAVETYGFQGTGTDTEHGSSKGKPLAPALAQDVSAAQSLAVIGLALLRLSRALLAALLGPRRPAAP